MRDFEVHKRREQFHHKLRSKHLAEGYSYDDGKDFVTRPYWPLEPRNSMLPHLWRWSDILPLISECGEMIGLGHGSTQYDRRVLALTNPGGKGDFTLSGPLFGDIQLIRPGESAPCHRHTPAATRVILQGQGGWTTVAGDRVHVSPGDVVHTGQFPWHDHGNDGPDDFIFLDILDIPLLMFTGTSCWEFDYAAITGGADQPNQPAKVVDFPNHQYVQAHLRPTFKTHWQRNPADFAHLPWNEVKKSLLALEGEAGSAYDGLRCEFHNTSGGPVGRTMSVHTQWLRPGTQTLEHRHTGSSIFVAMEGCGTVQIENQKFAFQPKDIFVVPSWNWHAFASVEGCVLHSVSDLALILKMHLYREQRRSEDDRILDSGWTAQPEPFA